MRGHLHCPGRIDLHETLRVVVASLEASGLLENWLPWDGGACPLPDHVEVEVMWSDGLKQTTRASEIAWIAPAREGLVPLHQDLRFVIFYRVVRW